MRCVHAWVRSSFSPKVIPLGKTRKNRKSPPFAPKLRLRCFLSMLSLRPTVAAIGAPAVPRIVPTRVALTGPLRKGRGAAKREVVWSKGIKQCQTASAPFTCFGCFPSLLPIPTLDISTSPLLFALGPSASPPSLPHRGTHIPSRVKRNNLKIIFDDFP